MQDAGKIRHVGLSEVTPKEIERGEKGSSDRQRAEPIQHRRPQIGKHAGLLREREPRIHPVGSDWRRQRFVDGRPGNPLEAEAKRHNVSAVQLALAWLLQQSPVMLPIPGTSSLAHLEENMAAEKIHLSADGMEEDRRARAILTTHLFREWLSERPVNGDGSRPISSRSIPKLPTPCIVTLLVSTTATPIRWRRH